MGPMQLNEMAIKSIFLHRMLQNMTGRSGKKRSSYMERPPERRRETKFLYTGLARREQNWILWFSHRRAQSALEARHKKTTALHTHIRVANPVHILFARLFYFPVGILFKIIAFGASACARARSGSIYCGSMCIAYEPVRAKPEKLPMQI